MIGQAEAEARPAWLRQSGAAPIRSLVTLRNLLSSGEKRIRIAGFALPIGEHTHQLTVGTSAPDVVPPNVVAALVQGHARPELEHLAPADALVVLELRIRRVRSAIGSSAANRLAPKEHEDFIVGYVTKKADASQVPGASYLVKPFAKIDVMTTFESGLRLLLDGFEQWLAEQGSTEKKSRRAAKRTPSAEA